MLACLIVLIVSWKSPNADDLQVVKPRSALHVQWRVRICICVSSSRASINRINDRVKPIMTMVQRLVSSAVPSWLHSLLMSCFRILSVHGRCVD